MSESRQVMLREPDVITEEPSCHGESNQDETESYTVPDQQSLVSEVSA